MMTTRKAKKNSWHELKEEKCPGCGQGLMRNMFEEGFVGCSCGFNLDEKTKELLVNRDADDKL